MSDNMNHNQVNPENVAAILKMLIEAAKNQSNTSNPAVSVQAAPVQPMVKLCDPKGLRVIRGDSIHDLDYLDTGDPNVKCYYKTLFDVKESPHFMPVMLEIDHSSFDWYCGYAELDYVIEGTFCLTIDGRHYTLKPGDVSLIPMRSQVTFASPDHCKVFAVVYPTNWGDYC